MGDKQSSTKVAEMILRIEIFRNGQWTLRGEAAFNGTVEQIKAAAPGYAARYDHRFYLDGELVHEQKA